MPGSTHKISQILFTVTVVTALIMIAPACHVSYGLHDVSIPPEVKTVKVNFLENHARYVNPQLSPSLTDRLRQKIVGQTRLTQTNGDNADW
ncbi:MAG TPA: hypothetical protein VGC95_12840, partial [Chitinophagaceae bacterium]